MGVAGAGPPAGHGRTRLLARRSASSHTGLRSVSNHGFYARHGHEIVARDPAAGIVRLAKSR